MLSEPSLLSNLHCLSTSSVLSKINSLYIFGQLVPLFLDVKNDVLARITEPSNDDYDNGVSDNSHNMILMSKYKGKHGGKKR